MRTNLPVTGREYSLPEGASLVSMTDTHGRITLANADFVAASGFAESELLGQPHNIVRHPDMPPAAFEDMWTTLKAGRPWTGLVKNRRKDGDHYWVVANATPVREGGTVTGYMSVRTRPSREQVEQAERAYRAIREGRDGLGVKDGRVVKTAWWHRANPAGLFFGRLTLSQQIALIGLLVAGAIGVIAWELGTRMRGEIAVIAKEREGSAVHKPLRDLLAAVQRHRGLAASAAAGSEKARAALPEASKSVEAAMRATDEADARHGASTGSGDTWKGWKAQWAGVAARASTAPAREVLETHTAAVVALLELMRRNADGSGLVLDPELDTFNLMDLFALKLPPIAERLALARGTGASLLAQKSQDAAARRSPLVAAEAAGAALADASKSIASLARASAESAAKLEGPARASTEAVKAFANAIEREVVAPRDTGLDAAAFFERGTAAVEAIYALHDAALAEFDRSIEARETRLKREALVTAVVSALLVLTASIAAFVTLRRVSRRLAGTAGHFHRIAEGDYSAAIDTTGRDEIAQMLVALKSMQIRLGFEVNRAKRTAEEALRIQQALDSAEMPVRIADDDGRIVYVNHALERILQRDEAAFRAELPGFEAAKVVGSSIGLFYKDPQEAIARLRSLESTITTRLTLGGRIYDVTTSPVRSASGERLGTVGQWADRTEQLAVEREIGEIVEAAARGDFERRVSLEGKQGFFLELSKGLNALLATTAQGLEEVVRMLAALSRGDLTARIDRDFEGTFARMKEDANATVAKLTEIVGHIQGSADAIGTASRQIAAGNQDLSSRTEEQASSLQQTASSMEQLTSTVKQNAENAKQANQLAASASENATKGGQVVGQVIDTMGSIQSSSEKIVDIIGVIDGIAFQTNILALNAAVEAARAGEQGRGFAVVASEVRNLAQRSAAAAKEIKALIGDSVGKVDAGTRLVEAAGRTMDDIVASVRRVTDIMAEITAASLEQSSGIEQVRQAIVQMDQVTQQNAALVEEAAAAAESMREQAGGLTEAVAVFRTGTGSDGVPALPVAPPAGAKPRATARRPAVAAGGADDEWEEI